ncbi:MAG: [FeFe] hydrogenase H-cluster radical SAM maturase HydG [Desulfotalea sp.]
MQIEPNVDNNFIDPEYVWSLIHKAVEANPTRIREVLEKAKRKQGLSPFEVAILLENSDEELDKELFETARQVKQETYGNRIVLFAPLYISNECANRCSYCGFSVSNKELVRKTLSTEEIIADVKVLEESGQKRLLLVYGEHPKLDAKFIADSVATVYQTLSGKGAIRRVNVNCAPLDVAGFRVLKDAEIGTYQCFQETYHQPTYEAMHLGGNKRNFLWRLQAMHRAQEAGIDDVGIGVLFGLYDHRFELISMLLHAEELEKKFGAGPHTISFPRLEEALGADISTAPPYAVSDYTFSRIVAITRLAVPYTGIIMSTRESAEMRTQLLQLGISQLSAASRTYPGAYSQTDEEQPDRQQFCLGDHRSLDEVVLDLVEQGFMPSWCTACYRTGRTGEYFMSLAKDGFIQKFCLPNSIMTFKEYLEDYASPATRKAGEKHVKKEMELCTEKGKNILQKQLDKIVAGERDLFL